MNVDVHYLPPYTGRVYPLIKLGKEIHKRCGIKLTHRKDLAPDPKRSPCLITSLDTFPKTPEHYKKIIILELERSSSIGSRKEIHLPNVVSIWKLGILRPIELNNPSAPVHARTLGAPVRDPTMIDPINLANKAVPAWIRVAYPTMDGWERSKPRIDRKFDVHFVGSTNYAKYPEVIRKHRMDLMRVLKTIPGKRNVIHGKRMGGKFYKDTMYQSKIVISPWGSKAMCFREMEAMFAGCVVIKPDTSFVKTWPDLYENGVTYIPCRYDWLDLKERVIETLSIWEELKEMRENNRNMVVNSRHKELLPHIVSLLSVFKDG